MSGRQYLVPEHRNAIIKLAGAIASPLFALSLPGAGILWLRQADDLRSWALLTIVSAAPFLSLAVLSGIAFLRHRHEKVWALLADRECIVGTSWWNDGDALNARQLAWLFAFVPLFFVWMFTVGWLCNHAVGRALDPFETSRQHFQHLTLGVALLLYGVAFRAILKPCDSLHVPARWNARVQAWGAVRDFLPQSFCRERGRLRERRRACRRAGPGGAGNGDGRLSKQASDL